MKQAKQGRVYLQAAYAGHRPEIKRELQQISVLKDDIYGYIVETESGQVYGYQTMRSLWRDWKRG